MTILKSLVLGTVGIAFAMTSLCAQEPLPSPVKLDIPTLSDGDGREEDEDAPPGTRAPDGRVPAEETAFGMMQDVGEEPIPALPTRDDEQSELLPPAGDSGAEGRDEEEDAETADDEAEEITTLFDARWHELGPITANCFYIGETFNNTRGGISTKGATRYRGNLDLELSLDTTAAQWWDDGQFYVYMQHSHGTTLRPEFTGDSQYYSSIDTGPKSQDLTQLGEYWYQHIFGEDLLSVRMGPHDPNNEFAFADLGGDFINSSFLTLPNIPMPYWPFQTMGVSSMFQPSAKLRLGGGAFDQGRDIGQWWASTASRGMFYIAQADYMPFADREDAGLTILRGGCWYSSSDTFAVDESGVFADNYGFYATVDKTLYLEADSTDQGLGAFFQYSWAPPERNQVDQAIGAGLVYTGLLPGRDKDSCGGGFTTIEFSPELGLGDLSENAAEVFYKARLTSWMSIIPDLQYIARPSGIYPDALAAGIRFEVTL